VELLAKQLEDADVQLIECMQQIKNIAEEKETREKELEELRSVVQVVINMVDLPKEGVASDKTLLKRLHEAPQKITGYISETIKTYVAHILGLVKSYWPKANLSPLVDDMSVDYSDKNFLEFVEEVKPMAHQLVDSLEQE
jgi:ribonuclease D